jgi:RNA recognition motif-containing protein
VQVTEEQLASLFKDCGQVVDCRVCGDANSTMRFAFIEFVEEEAINKVGFSEMCLGMVSVVLQIQSCGR